jgi:simple sugar transport system ATP-binding protein
VLILDEPTASLGAAEADRLFEVVDRLRSQGVAILYISHRMGDIRRLADRVVVLRNGRQVFEQRRPFDLAAAIRQMVGRDLGEALTDRPAGPSGEPVLRLDQVQLRADSRPFDLEIRAGEIIAVTGALGSGKATFWALSSVSVPSYLGERLSTAPTGAQAARRRRSRAGFF